MRKFLTATFLLGFMLMASLPVRAADDVPRHPELQKFEKDGGTVSFLGNAYGLDGWLLTKGTMDPRTVYTTREGGLVMGMLVGPDGAVRTTEQLAAMKARMEGAQDALPGADASVSSKSEKLYAEIEKARWLKVGSDKAPYIYVIMNVGCDHCQKYFKVLQSAIKNGSIQVRLLPFGATAVNRDAGAALLNSKDPGADWLQYIDGKVDVLSKDKATADSYKAIDDNTTMMNAWKMQAPPPYTIYRKRSDGKIIAMVGLPENMMLIHADLLMPDPLKATGGE